MYAVQVGCSPLATGTATWFLSGGSCLAVWAIVALANTAAILMQIAIQRGEDIAHAENKTALWVLMTVFTVGFSAGVGVVVAGVFYLTGNWGWAGVALLQVLAGIAFGRTAKPDDDSDDDPGYGGPDDEPPGANRLRAYWPKGVRV